MSALNQASRKAAEARIPPMKAVSVRPLFIKVVPAIQTGCLSLTKNGQQSRSASEAWLDPTNFDANGQQKQSLRDSTKK